MSMLENHNPLAMVLRESTWGLGTNKASFLCPEIGKKRTDVCTWVFPEIWRTQISHELINYGCHLAKDTEPAGLTRLNEGMDLVVLFLACIDLVLEAHRGTSR